MRIGSRIARVPRKTLFTLSGPLILNLAPAGPVAGQAEVPFATACPPPGASSVDSVRITGIVRDDASGASLPGARMFLSYAGGSATADLVSTANELGRFAFCVNAAVSSSTVWAEYAGRPGRARRVEHRRDETAEEPFAEVEIDLGDPAFLVFTLVDAESRAPIPTATLRLEPLTLGGVSNSAGRATLRRVPPGRYRLKIDHIAYASFEATLDVPESEVAEIEVPVPPRVIAVAPIEVRVTGRDPFLVDEGFYDRQARIDDGFFYTYWEVENYELLSNFFAFKKELIARGMGPGPIFINGRRMDRLGYRSMNEIPINKIRGIEWIRCAEMPARYQVGLLDIDFGGDCRLTLIWLGNRRVRDVLTRPDDDGSR